jgi:hypothetical protein
MVHYRGRGQGRGGARFGGGNNREDFSQNQNYQNHNPPKHNHHAINLEQALSKLLQPHQNQFPKPDPQYRPHQQGPPQQDFTYDPPNQHNPQGRSPRNLKRAWDGNGPDRRTYNPNVHGPPRFFIETETWGRNVQPAQYSPQAEREHYALPQAPSPQAEREHYAPPQVMTPRLLKQALFECAKYHHEEHELNEYECWKRVWHIVDEYVGQCAGAGLSYS